MDLIATIDNESGTTYDVTGLSAYRELIISVENIKNTDQTWLAIQLYSTSGAAWRTSNYLNAALNSGNDLAQSTIGTAGLVFAKTANNGRDYFNGIIRISNFNDASVKTSHHATGVTTKTNYVTSSTPPSDRSSYTATGLYDTAEAHEGIRFRVKNDNSFSAFYATIWGVKS